jgi:hypothetical protein
MSDNTSAVYGGLDTSQMHSGVTTAPFVWPLRKPIPVTDPETHTYQRIVTPDNKVEFVEIDPDQAWFWTEEWQASERRVDEYLRKGEFEEFDSMGDFLSTLDD